MGYSLICIHIPVSFFFFILLTAAFLKQVVTSSKHFLLFKLEGRGLFLKGFMVNSYFYKLVLSQLVLCHWSTRTFLQLVLWSTRTFSLVNPYFSLVNSYFFFGQLVLFEKKYLRYALLLYYGTSCALNRDYINPADSRPIKCQILATMLYFFHRPTIFGFGQSADSRSTIGR